MKFIKLWVPVFLWAGLIFYLSGIPQLSTGWGIYDLILRKIAHISEYFILAWLLYRAFQGSLDLSSLFLFFWSFSLSFLYALSDEVHQFFVFGRSCSSADLAIDTLGIIGFFLFLKFKHKPSSQCSLKTPK